MTGSRRFIERCEFQTSTASRTGSGRPVESWTKLFDRRCEVKPTGNTEGPQDNQHQSSSNYTITLPHDQLAAAINTNKARVIWHGKTGDVTLNLKGKDITSGRRPDLTFQATTDSD